MRINRVRRLCRFENSSKFLFYDFGKNKIQILPFFLIELRSAPRLNYELKSLNSNLVKLLKINLPEFSISYMFTKTVIFSPKKTFVVILPLVYF